MKKQLILTLGAATALTLTGTASAVVISEPSDDITGRGNGALQGDGQTDTLFVKAGANQDAGTRKAAVEFNFDPTQVDATQAATLTFTVTQNFSVGGAAGSTDTVDLFLINEGTANEDFDESAVTSPSGIPGFGSNNNTFTSATLVDQITLTQDPLGQNNATPVPELVTGQVLTFTIDAADLAGNVSDGVLTFGLTRGQDQTSTANDGFGNMILFLASGENELFANPTLVLADAPAIPEPASLALLGLGGLLLLPRRKRA